MIENRYFVNKCFLKKWFTQKIILKNDMIHNKIINSKHSFNRSGLATLSDLQTSMWKNLFNFLEKEQKKFFHKEKHFRSSKYIWPRNPLHTWSRIWEYPYVYYHLEKIRQENFEKRLLTVTDFGSGVTFFPFTVARLGYNVTCIDIDPICAHDIPRATNVVDSMPGKVGVKLSNNNFIPLPDNSQDVVYCISVLEHIPNFEQTISEIARILKSDGKFILTVDLDLRGNSELCVDGFKRLQNELVSRFELIFPEMIVHPSDVLTTVNSPFKMINYSFIFIIKRIIKMMTNKQLVFSDPRIPFLLTVYTGSYIKK